MLVKTDFTLMKKTPNVLSLSSSTVGSILIPSADKKIVVLASMMRDRIKHFTKDRVFRFISGSLKERGRRLHVVNMSEYMLPVSYNTPTNGIVINVSFFGTDDIYPNNPSVENIYACLVYGICFSDLVTGRFEVKDSHLPIFVNYLLSFFVQLFGKKFGLLSRYSKQIPFLRFLLTCYVLSAFGGRIDLDFRVVAREAGVDIHEETDLYRLSGYDFTRLDSLLVALVDFKVTPGLDKFEFLRVVLQRFGFIFIPMIEDVSRFVSTIVASEVPRNRVTPYHLDKYDIDSYGRIIDLAKKMF